MVDNNDFTDTSWPENGKSDLMTVSFISAYCSQYFLGLLCAPVWRFISEPVAYQDLEPVELRIDYNTSHIFLFFSLNRSAWLAWDWRDFQAERGCWAIALSGAREDTPIPSQGGHHGLCLLAGEDASPQVSNGCFLSVSFLFEIIGNLAFSKS